MDTQNQNPQPAPSPAPAPAAQAVPAPAPAPQTKAEQDKEANKLCIISLVCRYAAPTIIGVLGGVLSGLAEASDSEILETAVALPMGLVLLGARLASWILVIMARVKYKESTFPKVLLIIYIVGVVLTFLAFILIIALFAQLLSDCAHYF